MYSTSKTFYFEAAHQLSGLPNNADGTPHACSHPHWHAWRVEVIFASPSLERDGIFINTADLDPFEQYIATQLHKKQLNTVFNFISTPENLARYFHSLLKKQWPKHAITVGVSDTRRTWASYADSEGQKS